jgi:hypothetical protein
MSIRQATFTDVFCKANLYLAALKEKGLLYASDVKTTLMSFAKRGSER